MAPQQPPRFEELLTPPIVGETYLVRCVELDGDCGRDLVPIVGPLHEDAAFLHFPEEHYHLNRPFLTEQQGRRAAEDKTDPMERILGCLMTVEQLMEALHASVVMKNRVKRGPLHRPLVCLRAQPAYPSTNALHWLAELEAAFAGATVKDHRCPHRGLPLGNVPPDEHGRITCPGHGLRFDGSGRLCPRTPAEWERIHKVSEVLRRVGIGRRP